MAGHDHRVALPIPLSLVFSVLFVGVQFVVYVPSIIGSRSISETVYAVGDSFVGLSLAIAGLLLAYLGLDFWRWRQRPASSRRAYHAAFLGTAVLVIAMLVFLSLAATLET